MNKQCLLCEILLNRPFTESCASACAESNVFGLFRSERRDSSIGGAVDAGCGETATQHQTQHGIKNYRVEWDDPIQ